MHKKFVIIVLIVISTLLGVSGYFANTQYEENTPFEIPPENVNMASMTNYNNINSIFAEKISDYATYILYILPVVLLLIIVKWLPEVPYMENIPQELA